MAILYPNFNPQGFGLSHKILAYQLVCYFCYHSCPHLNLPIVRHREFASGLVQLLYADSFRAQFRGLATLVWAARKNA